MPTFDHVNIVTTPETLEAEAEFLVEVLGLTVVDPGDFMRSRGARWFALEGGAQVHLQADPAHQPELAFHAAVDFGDDIGRVEQILAERGIAVRVPGSLPEQRVFCHDPAGNEWELRGNRAAR